MRHWARIDPAEFLALPLRIHAAMYGVPIHDVWRVDLPGGGAGRTISDVRSLFDDCPRSARVNVAVRVLFAVRVALGKIFRWDTPQDGAERYSFRSRLSEDDIRNSIVDPGTSDPPFTVLFVHRTESLGEVRNRTVQAFSAWALVPTSDGYRLYWAIYVVPVGPWTSVYMTLIAPFRRWVVYPSILRRIHRRWEDVYGA